MGRKTRCHEGDSLPASWSWGTGGGEARGIVSRASSHRRMAVQSGLTAMLYQSSSALGESEANPSHPARHPMATVGCAYGRLMSSTTEKGKGRHGPPLS